MFAQTKIRRIQTQYIAALAPQGATSGTDAETWGLWKVDPGPIGVWLRFYQALQKAGNIAPSGWRFDIDDWWLDENGLIMKAPEFPIPAGQYYVTNGEENIFLLTVGEADADGKHAWSLPYEEVRVDYAKRDKTKRQEHVSDRTGSLELACWRDNSTGQSLVTSDLERLRLLGIALGGAGNTHEPRNDTFQS